MASISIVSVFRKEIGYLPVTSRVPTALRLELLESALSPLFDSDSY